MYTLPVLPQRTIRIYVWKNSTTGSNYFATGTNLHIAFIALIIGSIFPPPKYACARPACHTLFAARTCRWNTQGTDFAVMELGRNKIAWPPKVHSTTSITINLLYYMNVHAKNTTKDQKSPGPPQGLACLWMKETFLGWSWKLHDILVGMRQTL